MENNDILVVTHNAGFFSCCSIRLLSILDFFNKNKRLPKIVDSSQQFILYKSNNEDITPLLFSQIEGSITYIDEIRLSNSNDEPQFSNYEEINFEEVRPFINKYFSPSEKVKDKIQLFESEYKFDYDNICAIDYRGNDKGRETSIANHQIFIEKCIEIRRKNSGITFLIHTDEMEFLNTAITLFPNSIFIKEKKVIPRQDTIVVNRLPSEEKTDHAITFLASTIIISKCKFLITHSGNCANWAVLFRGNMDNVYQYITSSLDNPKKYNYWNK